MTRAAAIERVDRHLSWACLVVLAACAPGSAQPSESQQAGESPQPFRYLEMQSAGAAPSDRLPLVVALHGRGDRPEWFAGLFDGFATPARIVVPHPPHRFGDGLAWYLGSWQSSRGRTQIARELVAHATRIRATVEAVTRARPTRGRPVVMGFSQGAMLAYTIALTQPDAFAAAFPISGFFYRETPLPARIDPARIPRIVAWHGRADRLVTLADDRRGVDALRARGISVELREHDAAHTIPAPIRRDLLTEITSTF